jgi:hypothetical protein
MRIARIVLSLMVLAVSAPAFAEDMLTFKLVARDGRFTPDTLEAPAGKRFKIVIRNEGPGAIEFESESLRREKVLAPNSESFVVIQPLKAGTYDFFDEFHSTTGRGKIIVK